jgi:RHS repeat-associated protein
MNLRQTRATTSDMVAPRLATSSRDNVRRGSPHGRALRETSSPPFDVPEYMVRGADTYRLVTDHLGSVRLVVKVSDGSVAERIDYDEFGVVTSDTSPGLQPFGFAGGLYDADTRLSRFGARDYDAETGRWTAKDPIGFDGGQTNVYVYVRNDPVNDSDPDGLLSDACKECRIRVGNKHDLKGCFTDCLGRYDMCMSQGRGCGAAPPNLKRQCEQEYRDCRQRCNAYMDDLADIECSNECKESP